MIKHRSASGTEPAISLPPNQWCHMCWGAGQEELKVLNTPTGKYLNQKEKLSYTAATVSNSLTRQNFHTPRLFFTRGEETCRICIHTSNVVLSPHAYETPLSTELLPLPFSLFQDFYSKSPALLEQWSQRHFYSWCKLFLCLPPGDGVRKGKKCKSFKVAAKTKPAKESS